MDIKKLCKSAGWRKVMIGTLALFLILATVGAVTSAYYNDDEVVVGNQFTAGTLDLSTCGNNIIVSDVKPGFTGRGGQSIHDGMIGIQVCKNDGNNPGNLTWAIRNVLNTEGLNPEPEVNKAEPGDLGDVLYVDKIVIGIAMPGNQVTPGTVIVIGKTVNDLSDDPPIVTGVTIPVGATYYCELYWSVPGSVGNDIMGDKCTFDIVLGFEQIPVP